MIPNIDLQDIACLRRKRPQENSERDTRTEWREAGGLQRPLLVLVKRSQDSVVTLSGVIVQIFTRGEINFKSLKKHIKSKILEEFGYEKRLEKETKNNRHC